MGLDSTTAFRRVFLGLLLACVINAGILVTATVLDGLQFQDAVGAPDWWDYVFLVFFYLFFSTPVIVPFVVPLGLLAWWLLHRWGMVKIWLTLILGLAVGYAISFVIPHLPDQLVASQLSSPLREIASTLAGGVTGLIVGWRGRLGVLD
ncbi:hypothetical protein [Hyphobacterium sp.]|uniref:hypothetical protein n=1 Tax=Hyphobacterium sp. TaxID=2004662 RepID=UPI003B52AFCA